MRRIIRICEKLAPLKLAAEWDNVGIIIGDATAQLKGVMVALDVTEEAIEAAVSEGCNLMIVHHPPIFAAIRQIDTKTPQGKIIKRLLQTDISVYAMHTNLDSAPGGLNHHVARMIGLKKIRPVSSAGITYRIGELPVKVGAKRFAAQVKKRLGLRGARLYGGGGVKKVAVCTGSGADMLADAASHGADCLVTGDVRHHQGLDCRPLGIGLLDAGHFGTEQHMVELVCGYLKKNLTKPLKKTKIRIFHQKEPFEDL